MKERKYQVILPNVLNRYLCKSFKSKYSSEFYNFLDHIPPIRDVSWQFEFTEEEIKAIDPLYWNFRKEV